jgi:hypothetical protein
LLCWRQEKEGKFALSLEFAKYAELHVVIPPCIVIDPFTLKLHSAFKDPLTYRADEEGLLEVPIATFPVVSSKYKRI